VNSLELASGSGDIASAAAWRAGQGSAEAGLEGTATREGAVGSLVANADELVALVDVSS
jgi:hypothetical protein